ncbi:WD repeat-containing protein 5B [Niveomyces insectorum RCEF 264]|uniref:WD repeat-containing protein 5B n=1 Tax=Niveomyces insectorum RCEF 264 TaxID=1081102 RepID=A0A167QTH4_9HYPO|nr:WD repeat-containing protein 5B [Niveomyces insectorum RCEF 264]
MATKKVRQRISYVLEDARSVGHRLGVNGLAVDSENNILYSGGRDGVVCAWDLHLDRDRRAKEDDDNDDGGDQDQTNGKKEAAESTADGKRQPADAPAAAENARPHAQIATCRAQTQAHTHWINDIALAQNNSALVTASSDLLVKVWRPRADDNDDEPAILGKHADYVKCVASPGQEASWVASGGLDRRICLWDLAGGGKTLEIDVSGEEHAEKGSVYALRATHSILASGGPESTVRLWDPRAGGKNITKFVGHTDNVRAILVNEAGDTVLTASADQTVKVWSVTAGRCMQTLTMHNDSVWSLFSARPDLAVFYSSDRAGLVVKTDVRGGGVGDGSGSGSGSTNCFDDVDNTGLCVAVAQEHDGVSKVVASSGFLWTATSSSSINRWADVDTGGDDPQQQYANPPRALSPSADTIRPHSSSVSTLTANGGVPLASPALRVVPADIPAKSILRITNTALFPAPLAAADAVTLSGSPGAASSPPTVPSSGAAGTHSRKGSVAVPADDAAEGVEPVHRLPVETIEGNFGLVKHRLLNDRRRVLTLDTAGEVLLWDIINCKQLRKFGKRHLEDVEPEVNTTEAVAPWCSIDVSSGNLMVVLEQYNCFDAEMYADELVLDEPIAFREDQRINLGKWIMRYLFANLIDEELRRDEVFRAKLNEAVEKRIQAAAAAGTISMLDVGNVSADGRLGGGAAAVPPTPGIALATPLPSALATTTPATGSENRTSQAGRPSVDKEDYFSNVITSVETPAPAGLGRTAGTQGAGGAATSSQSGGDAQAGDGTKDTGGKTPNTPFGKKFRMGMSFGTKKLGRSASTTVNEKTAGGGSGGGGGAGGGGGGGGGGAQSESKSGANGDDSKGGGGANDENRSDAASSSHDPKDAVPVDDCFVGVLQRMHNEYERQLADHPTVSLLESRITPCPEDEAPRLALPPNTKVIIQEELKGGSIELYRGTVGELGQPRDVDKIERCAPLWLGEALLTNHASLKEANKISFLLLPYKDSGLPNLAAPDGNNRLNANRMLRVKKILAYVADKIDQPPPPPPAAAAAAVAANEQTKTTADATGPDAEGGDVAATSTDEAAAASAAVDEATIEGDAAASDETADSTITQPEAEAEVMKPEEYLDLYCNDQRLPHAMSLATVRAHIWKNSNDILLYYRANGRKALPVQQPAAANGEGGAAAGTEGSGEEGQGRPSDAERTNGVGGAASSAAPATEAAA